MSSHPDVSGAGYGRPLDDAQLLERVEDYLDHLCAPLVGIVDHRAHMEWRLEVRLHLDECIEENLRSMPPTEAAEAALREFGAPWGIGKAFAEQWSQASPTTRLERFVGANLRAFVWFGLATLLNLVAIEFVVFERAGEGLQPYIVALALTLPIIAGCLTGTTVQGRAAAAVGRIVPVLAVDSLATGLLMLPDSAGIAFAAFQVLYWLPAGLVSAALTGNVRDGRRRRSFLRSAA